MRTMAKTPSGFGGANQPLAQRFEVTDGIVGDTLSSKLKGSLTCSDLSFSLPLQAAPSGISAFGHSIGTTPS
jgi:hypothetical protein